MPYVLLPEAGTVRTFTAGSDSSTTVTVKAGGTVAAGTMTFATAEEKHYLTTADSDGTETLSTTNYVQATKDGLKFVLASLPDNASAFVLGIDGYYDASGTYHTLNDYNLVLDKTVYGGQSNQPADLPFEIYTFRLVDKNVTYKVYATIYDENWSKLQSYYSSSSSTDTVTSVGGLGMPVISNSSAVTLNWDQSSSTISAVGVPAFDFSNFSGTISAFRNEIQVNTSKTSTNFDKTGFDARSIAFTPDNLSAGQLENICGNSGVGMCIFYKIRLADDYDQNVWSSVYTIHSIHRTDLTVNAFTPTITLDANGGTFTPVSGGTEVSTITLSKGLSGAFTPKTTFAEVMTALDTYTYTYTYMAGDISAKESSYCTDSNGNIIPVSNTSQTLGYTDYKVVFHWTLPLTTDNCTGGTWTGTYETKNAANVISLDSGLLSTYTDTSSSTSSYPFVLTVTATETPSVDWIDTNGNKVISCTPATITDGTGDSTYSYTLQNYIMRGDSSISGIYISGSNSTITSVVLAAQ
ncbi:MAG: hypothetical protein M0P01_00860 [Treponema sp.]|nr:hypothetical protein [Treponema sp.]